MESKLEKSGNIPANAIQVLDYGFVSLVDKLGTDLTPVNAARVSFGKVSTEFSEKDGKLITRLANPPEGEEPHTAPFRHAMLQFHIKAPEFIMRQWYKHVVGCEWTSGERRFVDSAWNEISGRYVEYDPEFYVPAQFRPQATKNKQASADGDLSNKELFTLQNSIGDTPFTVMDAYKLSISDSFSWYKKLLNAGVSREQARCLLPVSFYSEVYWTCSLQAAAHFVKLRSHSGAQYEIQEYAKAIEKFMRDTFPVSAEELLK